MGWRKSPQGLVDLFATTVPEGPDVERRTMFGYPAAFVRGHLFAGLHQESFILRLSEPDRECAMVEHGARPFEPLPGRRMRDYVVVPAAVLSERRRLDEWIARAMHYVASIPRRHPKPPRRRADPTTPRKESHR